jgi:hypothetical protein
LAVHVGECTGSIFAPLHGRFFSLACIFGPPMTPRERRDFPWIAMGFLIVAAAVLIWTALFWVS